MGTRGGMTFETHRHEELGEEPGPDGWSLCRPSVAQMGSAPVATPGAETDQTADQAACTDVPENHLGARAVNGCGHQNFRRLSGVILDPQLRACNAYRRPSRTRCDSCGQQAAVDSRRYDTCTLCRVNNGTDAMGQEVLACGRTVHIVGAGDILRRAARLPASTQARTANGRGC